MDGGRAGVRGGQGSGDVGGGRMLDRFDVVLGLTGASLVILSVVDLAEPFDDPRAFMLLLVGHAVLDDPIVVDATDSPRLFWAALTAASPVVVVRRLLEHDVVTRQTLFGALAGYLLIAIALSFAFHAIGVLQSAPFFGTA
jgi:uncharacterized protein (DUF983 family)